MAEPTQIPPAADGDESVLSRDAAPASVRARPEDRYGKARTASRLWAIVLGIGVVLLDGECRRELSEYLGHDIGRSSPAELVEAAIARMGLSDVIDKQVRTFSRGMRQRLGVADLLIKRPQLIIMDEPTLGLDPEAARQFLQLIVELRDEGITLMLSSHLLHQVQAVCNRVGLFSKGKMELVGAVPELAQQVLGGGYRIHVQAQGTGASGSGKGVAGGAISTGHTGELLGALQRVPGVQDVQRTGDDRFLIVGKGDLRAEAAAAVVNAGGRLYGLDVEAPSLDEIYSRYFREVSHGTNA